ncbi:MAG TPA: hypothetical protein VKV28_13530 [Candidatus Binataceae bacterium]|nr:hypothetical protein [Candidatus Binataceae bacterium]
MENPVNVHEAKTHFSRLLNKIKLGEEVGIAGADKPIAGLMPLSPSRGARVVGQAMQEGLTLVSHKYKFAS